MKKQVSGGGRNNNNKYFVCITYSMYALAIHYIYRIHTWYPGIKNRVLTVVVFFFFLCCRDDSCVIDVWVFGWTMPFTSHTSTHWILSDRRRKYVIIYCCCHDCPPTKMWLRTSNHSVIRDAPWPLKMSSYESSQRWLLLIGRSVRCYLY